MISFIVIGQNEGWKITSCLESVFKTIRENNIEKFEVIYVDSKSMDDSVDRAKKFDEVNVFQITGKCNAAIARNIGADESKGDILFFIDGDMEIVPDFMSAILDDSGNLKFDSVTGHINDRFFTIDGKFLSEKPRTYKSQIPSQQIELTTSGGLLVIKRQLWEKAGGMRTKYKRSQDMDLVLRLQKLGVKTIRMPFLMAMHNTIDYRNVNRMWNMLFKGKLFYSSVLLRDHFFNKRFLIHSLRENYTSVFLLAGVLILLSTKTTFVPIVLYFGILLIRVGVNTRTAVKLNNYKFKSFYYLQRFIFQILRDISFLIAFFVYYPIEHQLIYSKK